MSLSLDSGLTSQALNMVFEPKGRLKRVMFHSDQGSHYTSRKYPSSFGVTRLSSVSRREKSWNNTPMERVF
jgi:putative transposase